MLPAHLEVYDHCKHEDSGNEVHEVWQVLSVEGLSQGTHLVRAGSQEMKESNDGSLKLSTLINDKSYKFSRFITVEGKALSSHLNNVFVPITPYLCPYWP